MSKMSCLCSCTWYLAYLQNIDSVWRYLFNSLSYDSYRYCKRAYRNWNPDI